MSTQGHTPGPWLVRESAGNHFVIDSTGSQCIAYSGPGLTEANARLIAAAPEMLEALRSLKVLEDEPDIVECGCHCADTGEGVLVCAWCKGRAAIAKAEGRD